jgi:TP901 family phage tail tape measure protein
LAGGIRGITVEIGGDTTKLGKALSDVNGKSKRLQSELRGVNSLLKFDPSNVTLLKQKQDLLNTSIATTKEKLNTLKTAQEQVLEQFERGEITEEQYRSFQREIVATEQKLKKLTEESKNFGSVSAQQIKLVGEKMQDVGSKVESVGKKFSKISAVTGAVLGGSTVLASNFQDSMAKVNTIADTSQVALGDLSAQILDLSNTTGIGAGEIANATYDAISAGQNTADAVNFVSNATSLARAGFADTGASIDLLTTILNAYGMEASEVSRVSDILINTQNRGKTTVAELSSSMGKIIPTANSMNVSLEQISAGYSIMTAKGIATAETTTYMNSMLNELGKSGTDVSDALKEKTGKSFQELMADGNSLGDVLQILTDYANDTGVGFNDLWGSSEAGKAAITLLSDGVGAFNDEIQSMNDSVGATSDALGKLETPSQKAKVAITQVKNSGIELGTAVLTSISPLIDKLAKSIEKLTTWFSNLSPGIQQTIAVVLGIVTALGPVIVIIGKLITSIGTILTIAPKIVTAFKAIGTAFKALGAVFMANPIGFIIGLLAALVAGLIYAYNHSEKFREIVNNAFEKVKEVVGNVVQALVDFFTVTIPNAISSMIDWFAKLPENIANFVNMVWTTVSTWVSNMVTKALELGSQFVSNILNFFNTLPERIGYIIGFVLGKIVQWGIDLYKFATTEIPKFVNTVIKFISELPGKIWNWLVQAFNKVVQWGSNMISTGKQKASEFVSSAVRYISELPGKIWTHLTNVMQKVIKWGSDMVSKGKQAARDLVRTIADTISELPGKMVSIGSDIVSGIWNGIKNAKDWLVGKCKDFASGIVDGFKSALHINSPSKVMANVVGKAIPEGIAKGINDNASYATEATDKLTDDLTAQTVNLNGATINRKLKTTFSGEINAGGSMSDIRDTIRDYGERLIEASKKYIVLDTGTLVGETLDIIDAGLEHNQILRERGV